ncbi:hypothetical protein [Lacunisphaera limnophila]|uniref:hypothetical protein n=1 Tax=Lacunisphaera limnophila TaxID=1838286 RepID=UPI000859745B|nr:hypothetical protein [Lacunisphaera limnophila]
MIDLHALLILFLAIVCAPKDTVEIGIFEDEGRSTYLVLEDGHWKHRDFGSVQNFTLERLEKKIEGSKDAPVVSYVGRAKVDSSEFILTDEYAFTNDLFELRNGVFLVRGIRSKEVTVVRKFEEGMNLEFQLRRPSVTIRWKKAKKG